MATGLGPDGLPAVYSGGAWVSQDRRFYWSGTAWIPIPAPSTTGPLLARVGVLMLFLAGIGYAVYSVLSTQSEFAAGYFVGAFVFFAVLIVVFRAVGGWGCFGIAIRGVTVFVAVLKILSLVTHPLPH